ncbi:hypothetical protein M422DRAFT_177245 [Sphaerobolus stellatus SS14]|uniref:CxC6 like cysteine cluster associated with KDZ domain-containing protein n=1 Tax=Sphaerobolus stellatus (strain SS14) TaxID=990650 RepID=A0A0C9UT13_SPHS4|nr:hypothetical protein M422DRAFT_177245 [Sphaerobolus stellatus SS14]
MHQDLTFTEWLIRFVICHWKLATYSHNFCLGAVRCVVTNSVTFCHPCCAVHDCVNPLLTDQHMYCTRHAEYKKKCAEHSYNNKQ